MSQPMLINRSMKYLESAINDIANMALKYTSTISVSSMMSNAQMKDDVTRFLSSLGDTLYKFQLARDDVAHKCRYKQMITSFFYTLFVAVIVCLVLWMVNLDVDLMKFDYLCIALCLTLYCFIIGTCTYITAYVVISRSFNMNMITQHKYVQKLTEMMTISAFSSTVSINTNNPILIFYTSMVKGWKSRMNIVINEMIPQSCDVVRATTNEQDFLTRCIPPSHSGHVYPFLGLDSVFPINDIKAGVQSFDQSLQSSDLYESIGYIKTLLLDQQSVVLNREQVIHALADVFVNYFSLVSDLSVKPDAAHVIIKVDDAAACFNSCLSDKTSQAATFDASTKLCTLCPERNLQFTYSGQSSRSSLLKTSQDLTTIEYPSGVERLYLASSFSPASCASRDMGCLVGKNGAPSYLEKNPSQTRYCAIAGADIRYALYEFSITNSRIVSIAKMTNYQVMLSTYSSQYTQKVCDVYKNIDPFFSISFNSALIDDIITSVYESMGKTLNVVCRSLLNDILLACPNSLTTESLRDRYITREEFAIKIALMTSGVYVNTLGYHIDRIRSCSKGLLVLNESYDSSVIKHDSFVNIFIISIIFLPVLYLATTVSLWYHNVCGWIHTLFMLLIGLVMFEIVFSVNKKSHVLFDVNRTLTEANNDIVVKSSETAISLIYKSILVNSKVPWSTSSVCNQDPVPTIDHMMAMMSSCTISTQNTLVAAEGDTSDLYDNLVSLIKAYDKCNTISVRDATTPPFPVLKFGFFILLLILAVIFLVYLVNTLQPALNIKRLQLLQMNNNKQNITDTTYTQTEHHDMFWNEWNRKIDVLVPGTKVISSDSMYIPGIQMNTGLLVSIIACVLVILVSILVVKDANSFEDRVYNSTKYRNRDGCINMSAM